MSGKRTILSEVMTARDEARMSLDRLSIEDHRRFYDLEAELETLQQKLASGSAGTCEPLLREAQRLSRQMLALVRPYAA